MEKIKLIAEDIWTNFKLPIILGFVLFIAINTQLDSFDKSSMVWYYISISLVTAGTVASLIYGLIKYFKK